MDGDLAQGANGDLYFIPAEMTDLLRVSDGDVETHAVDAEVEGFAFGGRGGLATPMPMPSPMPMLDLGGLQQQWERFGPSGLAGACSGGTDDSGAMGCPG